MAKNNIIWFLFSLILISCGRENFEISGEIDEDIPDPIEIDGVYLEGTIQNEFGQRLPGVFLQLYNEAGDVSETYTDGEGYFNFDYLNNLTESFRLVCLKEDHHLGLVNMDISELIDDSNVDVVLFSDLTGIGLPQIDNPFNSDFQLILGHIDNYKPERGIIFFQAYSQSSENFSFGFSDHKGNFQLWLTPGEDYFILGTDVCQNQIYIDQIEATDETIKELFITTQIPEESGFVNVFGTVINCQTGELLEDGVMLVAFDQSFHQEVYVQDGYFQFQVFECLLGTTIELFPQFEFSPPFPIFISTSDYQGSEDWNLGEISFCEEMEGEGDLLINGTDSLQLNGLVAIHFEERLVIFSNQFVCELEVDGFEIIGFKSIQLFANDFDKYSSYAEDGINIEVEVEAYSGVPGSPLVMNFFGQFIDENTFQTVTISGHIDTLVF